jgi:hypothetical protein
MNIRVGLIALLILVITGCHSEEEWAEHNISQKQAVIIVWDPSITSQGEDDFKAILDSYMENHQVAYHAIEMDSSDQQAVAEVEEKLQKYEYSLVLALGNEWQSLSTEWSQAYPELQFTWVGTQQVKDNGANNLQTLTLDPKQQKTAFNQRISQIIGTIVWVTDESRLNHVPKLSSTATASMEIFRVFGQPPQDSSMSSLWFSDLQEVVAASSPSYIFVDTKVDNDFWENIKGQTIPVVDMNKINLSNVTVDWSRSLNSIMHQFFVEEQWSPGTYWLSPDLFKIEITL